MRQGWILQPSAARSGNTVHPEASSIQFPIGCNVLDDRRRIAGAVFGVWGFKLVPFSSGSICLAPILY